MKEIAFFHIFLHPANTLISVISAGVNSDMIRKLNIRFNVFCSEDGRLEERPHRSDGPLHPAHTGNGPHCGL